MNTYKVKRVIAFSNEITWEPDMLVSIEYSGFIQLMLDADALELVEEKLTELIEPESNNDEKEQNKNVRNKRRI